MANQVDISGAEQILGLSERSIYRLFSKVRTGGVQTVTHGNSGYNLAVKISQEYKQKLKILQQGNIRN